MIMFVYELCIGWSAAGWWEETRSACIHQLRLCQVASRSGEADVADGLRRRWWTRRPPSWAPRRRLQDRQTIRPLSLVLVPPSARGTMWSSCAFALVSVAPHSRQGVPSAAGSNSALRRPWLVSTWGRFPQLCRRGVWSRHCQRPAHRLLQNRCAGVRGVNLAPHHWQVIGGLVLVEPKSRAGHRTISLPPQLVDALRTHRAEQAAERLRADNVWEDHHGLVFAQPNGRPVDPRADHRAWKNLLAAAGLPDARLHDARHTAATLLLSQGVPARVAMEILGHSQISLTLQTYSHVTAELHRDAADKVGEALWG